MSAPPTHISPPCVTTHQPTQKMLEMLSFKKTNWERRKFHQPTPLWYHIYLNDNHIHIYDKGPYFLILTWEINILRFVSITFLKILQPKATVYCCKGKKLYDKELQNNLRVLSTTQTCTTNLIRQFQTVLVHTYIHI